MSVLDQLTHIGLPSASVGLVLVAILLVRTHARASAAAALGAVAVMGGLAVMQLYDSSAYSFAYSSRDIQPVGANGPSALTISVLRGRDTVAADTIAQPTENDFLDRMRVLGLFRKGEFRNDRICFWETGKASVNDTVRLGQTDYGRLSLRVIEFKTGDSAVVSVELAGHKRAGPERLTIHNKEVGRQSFRGTNDDVFVVVTQANMTGGNPWAVFAVFTARA